MPTIRRTVLAAGLPIVVGAPALAQHPTPPVPIVLPAAGQTSAPGTPAKVMLGDVPLDLGALPQPAVPHAASPTDTPETTPTDGEVSAEEGTATAQPAEPSGPAAPASGRGQHALFDRYPVSVQLTSGQERLVQFPFVPMIDVPPSLTGRLEVQIIEDTAYLTANGPIPRTRLVAQAIDGGAKLPLDIEAIDGGDVLPMLQIHLPNSAFAEGNELAAAGADHESPARGADMIQLTRYAAQVLYAPSRLIPTSPGVSQEPVDRKPVAGLYRGGEVETAPLGAWSSGPLHVTAVRFTNRTRKAIELDMERLRGRWIAATPQHWRLLPHGSEADTTAVYLVSDRPFSAIPLWR